MKMRISLAIFLGAYTCYGISVDQTIRTSSGPVRGHAASVKQTVSSYLGIPYAKAPVGPLRFMPPVPYVSDKIINGSKIVRSAMQKSESELTIDARDLLVHPCHFSLLAAMISTTTTRLSLI